VEKNHIEVQVFS